MSVITCSDKLIILVIDIYFVSVKMMLLLENLQIPSRWCLLV